MGGAIEAQRTMSMSDKRVEMLMSNCGTTAVRGALFCLPPLSGKTLGAKAPSETEEERARRLEYQTAMALMSDEPSATSPSTGSNIPPDAERRPSTNHKERRQKAHRQGLSGDGEFSNQSETSSNTEKSSSPAHRAAAPAPAPAPPVAPAPALPTKRTIRELLETRDTPSKMEIGQGVLLAADISGAELVIIRGNFEGNIRAQCIDIEQGAEVRGKIECDAARINGKFDGVFVSAHSLQLASHADVSGRIIYRRLKVAKGAQLYGHSEYRSPVVN